LTGYDHWMEPQPKGSQESGEAEASQHFLREPITAAPGEGEGVAQDRTDMLFHLTFHWAAQLGVKLDKVKVEIDGHTDNEGSADYNRVLSEERAKTVMKYLINRGISPDRLTAKGYGKERPVGSNNTAEGRAKNRRVELIPVN